MSIKGKKQVSKLMSGERGRNITVLLCINAAGDQFIPPLFVFPRARIDQKLKKHAPEGSIFDAQYSGWITVSGFLKWLEAFIKHVHPTKESPVLLILDGHSTHKVLQVIHMLGLPPQASSLGSNHYETLQGSIQRGLWNVDVVDVWWARSKN